MSVDKNYKYWHEVRSLIDDGKSTMNRTALRDYCLTQIEVFKMGKASFVQYAHLKNFNIRQQVVIWEYLKEYHADKVEIILKKVQSDEAELI